MLISVKPAFGFMLGRWFLRVGPDPVLDGTVVGGCARSQRPTERPPTNGELQAREPRVQPCAAPRETALRIGENDSDAVRAGPEDHSQECRPAIRPTTPDTGAYRVAGPESSPIGSHQPTA